MSLVRGGCVHVFPFLAASCLRLGAWSSARLVPSLPANYSSCMPCAAGQAIAGESAWATSWLLHGARLRSVR